MTSSSQQFLEAVAATDFAARYYALCARFPGIGYHPVACTKKDVTRILAEIGRPPRWDGRDRSYSFPMASDEWTGGAGFVLQRRTTVEFWFVVRRGDECVGSHYSSIAHSATELVDPSKIPTPPYPRPKYTSQEDLKEILSACFALSDLLVPHLALLPVSPSPAA